MDVCVYVWICICEVCVYLKYICVIIVSVYYCVCACMCVYLCVYMCKCLFTCICVYTNVYVHVQCIRSNNHNKNPVWTHVINVILKENVCMLYYTCMHICMYVCIYATICLYPKVGVDASSWPQGGGSKAGNVLMDTSPLCTAKTTPCSSLFIQAGQTTPIQGDGASGFAPQLCLTIMLPRWIQKIQREINVWRSKAEHSIVHYLSNTWLLVWEETTHYKNWM